MAARALIKGRPTKGPAVPTHALRNVLLSFLVLLIAAGVLALLAQG